MMDIRDDQNHLFNIALAKHTGLYQMLDPQTMRFRGKNVYQIVLVSITLFMCVIWMILNVSGVYYWTDNIPLSIDYFWKGIFSTYLLYPICVIVHYSNDIWNCLSITCYGFTSNSLRDRHILDRLRERSVLLMTMMAYTYFTTMIVFFVTTLALSNDKLHVKNRDESYNTHYNMFYTVEALFCACVLTALFVFDFFLVTLCLAIRCQMQMVCTAFESVGHKSLGDDLLLVDCKEEKKKSPNEHDLIYDELKTIIMDHQAVMEKYNAFLTIFKRVVLLQIVVLLTTFIMLWFCCIMSFSNDERYTMSRIFTAKISCIIPTNLFKIFALCYLFGNLHDQKDSIIFALYSSNWTEMDIKCKKLILLIMKMNNSNYKKLKFTITRIVNMEMFFKTMRASYSILSVLINYIKNMDE